MKKTINIITFSLCATILASCSEDLYSNLSQREANEMVAVLHDAGIKSDRVGKAEGTYSLTVDKGDFAKATSALSARGYPHEKFATMAEVFGDKGLVKTPLAERARLVYAIDQELSQTLTELAPVAGARVHVVLPDTDPMKKNAPLSSASVVVRYREGADVALLGSQIRRMVAASVEGLSYERVAVTMFPDGFTQKILIINNIQKPNYFLNFNNLANLFDI